jgi:phosphoglycerol transferase MdoB-like AlkP superfamily enzyme
MQNGQASTDQTQEPAGQEPADHYRAHAKTLTILLASFCLLASSYSDAMLSLVSQFGSIYSFGTFLMLAAIVLPARLILLSIPLAVSMVILFEQSNELKISAVSLPITFDDVKTVIADPTVFANALGIRIDLYQLAPIAAGALIFVLAAFALCTTGWNFFSKYLRFSRPRATSSKRIFSFLLNAATLAAIVITAQTYLTRYGAFIHATLSSNEAKLWQELWVPASQVRLSRRLGFLEYIAFSSFAGHENSELPVEHSADPSIGELRMAAAKYVKGPVPREQRLLPNIVFFHAESTFNPNLAFRLSAPVKLPLWSKQKETRALGPLRVNVVGGGSWVTEFEVITGVDSRIFGYQGYYTHYYIAPKVKNSFAAYLASKGYKTAAFYSAEGSFYNVANAFKSYGFQKFIDGPALRLPLDWGELVDRDIITTVIEHGAFSDPGPFFHFIATSENHGPHPCRSFARTQEFLTTFAGTASFAENCQLNEYLRRAISTSAAFELVLNELRRVERQTGRPFVLLVYGDHQPWSFTGGSYSVAGGMAVEDGFKDFSKVRTPADSYQTIFHLLASDHRVIRSRFVTAPPASFLPTLVSAFVANTYEDFYLPVNFLAFASCGSDARASTCDRYTDFARLARNTLLSHPPLHFAGAEVQPARSARSVKRRKAVPRAS